MLLDFKPIKQLYELKLKIKTNMSISPQKLAYLNLGQKNPTYVNFAEQLTAPQTLSPVGTARGTSSPPSQQTSPVNLLGNSVASFQSAGPVFSSIEGTNQPTSPSSSSTAASPVDALKEKGVSSEVAQELINEAASKEFGGGMSKAELQDFETLVGRLESSKMRQADQGNRARQRATYAGGLASMMRNF